MIHFKVCRYKNILSTGNAWTEIHLDKNKSTLIVGDNGAGKSTILDAISFALYGRAFRNINKPQLLNSINQKSLMVELVFEIGKDEYLIKRGMKPTIFEIWKNGDLLNQDAASRDYQAYLEESVLKMNFKSFGQIVVLGSSTFVPFMQLPAKARREVIEDLLDIQIFTTMNSLLRDKVSSNKDEILEIKYKIELLNNKIDSAEEHNRSIAAIKKDEVMRIKKDMRDQIVFVEEENTKINELNDAILASTSLIVGKDEVTKSHSKVGDEIRSLEVKKKSTIKLKSFYETHDNCPSCKQGIEHDFKETTIAEHTTEIAEIDAKTETLLNEKGILEVRLEEIAKIEAEINSIRLKVGEHNANINMAKRSLKSLKSKLEEAEQEREEIDSANIVALNAELNGHHARQTELFDDKEVLAVVGSLLKDGGIKTRIIRQYVPVMNKLINKYLSAMDFFVDFQLDEAFNETIKSRFRDIFSYASFSEGEKLRIDLALLFTWRAISKLRNSTSTNLLIMDEIMDSSLDNSGTEEFLKIINDLTNDSNIFIISHKGDQLFDKFDHVIRFEKVKNFSRIAA